METIRARALGTAMSNAAKLRAALNPNPNDADDESDDEADTRERIDASNIEMQQLLAQLHL